MSRRVSIGSRTIMVGTSKKGDNYILLETIVFLHISLPSSGECGEDGSEMIAENSGTIILFSFKTQCVERLCFYYES